MRACARLPRYCGDQEEPGFEISIRRTPADRRTAENLPYFGPRAMGDREGVASAHGKPPHNA